MNTGTVSIQAGVLRPQGLVSTRTSRITHASMASVTALATVRNMPASSSTLPSGIPIRLPDSQAALSARYGTVAARATAVRTCLRAPGDGVEDCGACVV